MKKKSIGISQLQYTIDNERYIAQGCLWGNFSFTDFYKNNCFIKVLEVTKYFFLFLVIKYFFLFLGPRVYWKVAFSVGVSQRIQNFKVMLTKVASHPHALHIIRQLEWLFTPKGLINWVQRIQMFGGNLLICAISNQERSKFKCFCRKDVFFMNNFQIRLCLFSARKYCSVFKKKEKQGVI